MKVLNLALPCKITCEKKLLILVLFFISVLIPSISFAAIPPSERAALIALYNGIGGENWTNRSGWKTAPLHTDGFAIPGTEDDWYGVTVTDDHVTHISLSNNNLNGALPIQLGQLTSLIDLDLYYNNLTGEIPEQIRNLVNLENLNLSYNELSGVLPDSFHGLIKIKKLLLSNNGLTSAIFQELLTLNTLEELYLSYNQLDGVIPDGLVNLSNLKILMLERNELAGPIPPSLGNLSELEGLGLGGNQLTGTIPTQLGNLSNLRTLWLYNNQLTGNIPAELGDLINLQSITLYNNKLSGSIPEELYNLTNLQDLRVNNNQLSGYIPAEIGNLTNLMYLRLSGNKFSGSIPGELKNLANLSSSISNIKYNAIYTDDSSLVAFLDSINTGWKDTQTLSPQDVTKGSVTETTVQVQWSPVTYTADSGGYIVSYSTTPGGPYAYFSSTTSKSTTQMKVTGLDVNTTYYFTVQTYTNPHSSNQNTVISDYSLEISAATVSDGDNDGMSNDWEISYFGGISRNGTEDYDSDGLTDVNEYKIGANPTVKDTDSDGIPDGDEDKNRNGIVDTSETDPAMADTDGDGISDGIEDANHNGVVDIGETNPLNADTDNDVMPDGWEVQYDLDPLYNDANEDEDEDGYSNLKEYKRKTMPNDYNSQPSKGMPWLPLLLGE